MKAKTKTLLYVLGGLAALIGGGTAIYFATQDNKAVVKGAPPPAPIIPVSDPGLEQTTPLTQADQQQQQQQQAIPPPKVSPPPPPPQQIQLLQNLSQII